MRFLDWLKKFTTKKRNEVKYERPLTDDEYNEKRADRESKLNKILEKINSSGVNSLSQSEKNFLENYGEN
jgi:hypothetical protein